MKSMTVKDLMVPLSEYATCSEEATLYEAIIALEKAQEGFERSLYQHRAILVYDKNRNIAGKISQLDILRALEPKYKEMGNFGSLSRLGFSATFQRSMMEHYRLWDKPLGDICRKAINRKVKEFMYTPSEGEYVEEEASIDEAVHQLVMGHHQSLLAARKGEIVGILRLTDVFKEICQAVKACKIGPESPSAG